MTSFFALVAKSEKSYASWASALSGVIGQPVSKQALFKRMNTAWVNLLKILLQLVLTKHLGAPTKKGKFKLFRNVYLQDSTAIKLPDFMNSLFPGNYSKGKQKSVAKINVVMNAITGLCTHFNITGFTTNEQCLSATILDIAKKGDLVIRDLGYYSLQVFEKMIATGIYFISRQRFNTNLYDPKTMELLSVMKLIKRKNYVDINLLCGKTNKLPIRLVAIKLDSKTTERKIRKARQDRDKRLNHSKEFYTALGYIIFITNINKSDCTAQDISDLYRTRWQIELLFKSWKTGIKIESIIPNDQINTIRIEAVLYMILLYIAWFEVHIYLPIKIEAYKKHKKIISKVKLASFVIKQYGQFYTAVLSHQTIEQIFYYCCHEKRKRINATEHFNQLMNTFG